MCGCTGAVLLVFALLLSDSEGWLAVILGIAGCVIIAFTFWYSTDSAGWHKEHIKALHDLQVQGYQLKSLSVRNMEATILVGRSECELRSIRMDHSDHYSLYFVATPAYVDLQVVQTQLNKMCSI